MTGVEILKERMMVRVGNQEHPAEIRAFFERNNSPFEPVIKGVGF